MIQVTNSYIGHTSEGDPDKGTSILNVREVSKYFDTGERGLQAISGVSFILAPGEFLTIIGPSGCGKTTLLKLIAGFDVPSSGSVSLAGLPAPEYLSASVGYLFQRPNLFPWLRIRANVQFGARAAKTYPTVNELERATDAIIDSVGLAGTDRLFPYEVSGGMAARAAIARVLLAKPKILLMDEPFASLDALTKVAMHGLVKDLLESEGSPSAVLITHDISEALILSDRVLVMSSRPGRVVTEMSSPFRHLQAELADIETTGEFLARRRELLRMLMPEDAN